MGRQIWPGLNEYIKNGNIVRPTKYNALFLVESKSGSHLVYTIESNILLLLRFTSIQKKGV